MSDLCRRPDCFPCPATATKVDEDTYLFQIMVKTSIHPLRVLNAAQDAIVKRISS